MRKISILLLFLSFQLPAQWDSLGVTAGLNNPSIQAIDAFFYHQGRLLSNTFLRGIQYSDDYGQSWDTIAQGVLNGIPIEFWEVDQKLYVGTFINAAIGGYQYYSTDLGASWTIDTANMPRSPINNLFPAAINKVQQVGDYIFYEFNTPNGFYWRHKDSAHYHSDAFANSGVMSGWFAHNDTIWASMNGQCQYLSQPRRSYTATANNNLPIIPTSLISRSGSNVYFVGLDPNLDWTLYRSGDNGANWDTVHLQNDLGMGSFGLKRNVQSIFSNGDEIWLGPGSKGQNTQVEIFYSSDRGTTWQVQSQGLPMDPFGTNNANRFILAGGYLFASLNFIDVYRQSYNFGLIESKVESRLALYPNPNAGIFRIESDQSIKSIQVVDLAGNRVKEFHQMKSYDVSELHSGVYKVCIELQNGTKEIRNLLIL